MWKRVKDAQFGEVEYEAKVEGLRLTAALKQIVPMMEIAKASTWVIGINGREFGSFRASSDFRRDLKEVALRIASLLDHARYEVQLGGGRIEEEGS